MRLTVDQRLYILDRATTLASCRRDDQQTALEEMYKKMVELVSAEEVDESAV